MLCPSDRVRESALFIASQARHVSLETEGINRAAEFLSNQLCSLSYSDSQLGEGDTDPRGSEQDRTDWVFFISALNFCFWRPDTPYRVSWRGQDYSGYRAFCAAVSRSVESGVPLFRPPFYSQLTEERLGQLLRPESGQIPLLGERTRILREVGAVLCEMGGSVLPLVLSCAGSAQRLVSAVLEKFPSFRDEAPSAYDPSRSVCFYKRAQILAADLWNHFGGKGPGAFSDISQLTMFPDYRVPQVLFSLGAISYSPELLALLRGGQEIEKGGVMEQEIRGCSVRCVELLRERIAALLGDTGVQEAREKGWELHSVCLDYFLWRYSKRESGTVEASVPHHRTVTIFY